MTGVIPVGGRIVEKVNERECKSSFHFQESSRLFRKGQVRDGVRRSVYRRRGTMKMKSGSRTHEGQQRRTGRDGSEEVGSLRKDRRSYEWYWNGYVLWVHGRRTVPESSTSIHLLISLLKDHQVYSPDTCGSKL